MTILCMFRQCSTLKWENAQAFHNCHGYLRQTCFDRQTVYLPSGESVTAVMNLYSNF